MEEKRASGREIRQERKYKDSKGKVVEGQRKNKSTRERKDKGCKNKKRYGVQGDQRERNGMTREEVRRGECVERRIRTRAGNGKAVAGQKKNRSTRERKEKSCKDKKRHGVQGKQN